MSRENKIEHCENHGKCKGWRKNLPSSLYNHVVDLGYCPKQVSLVQVLALAKINVQRIEKADRDDELYMYYLENEPVRMAEIYQECTGFIEKYEGIYVDCICANTKIQNGGLY